MRDRLANSWQAFKYKTKSLSREHLGSEICFCDGHKKMLKTVLHLLEPIFEVKYTREQAVSLLQETSSDQQGLLRGEEEESRRLLVPESLT